MERSRLADLAGLVGVHLRFNSALVPPPISVEDLRP